MADVWDQFPDAKPAQPAGRVPGNTDLQSRPVLKKSDDPWSRFPDASPSPSSAPEPAPSLAMAPVGGAELLAAGVTGTVAQIPAGLAGIGTMIGRAAGLTDVDPADVVRGVQQYLTYRPQSDSARAGAELMGRGAQAVERAASPALERIGQVSPTAENVVRTAVPAGLEALATAAPLARVPTAAARVATAAEIPSMVQATRNVVAPFTPQPLKKPAPPSAEAVVSRLDSRQSMGAAAAAPSLADASPELRQAIVSTAQRTGGAINPEVLSRHIEADTLPVRMRLTEGQATQDPVLLSREQNLRGAHREYSDRFAEQNRQLADNMQAIRDEVGPDVFSTNQAEHGDTLIAAYRAKDEAATKIVREKYKELRDANGGQFPVDAKTLYDNAAAELHKRLLFDHAPASVMRTLERLSNSGNMTFENFEALRTNLARIQRSHTIDGNEKAAAGVIRDAMEQLPLSRETTGMKPLADAAREAARVRFRALEEDPAYKAAVDGSVPPDRFVNRFVIGAPRDQVAIMRRNLADNEPAIQTMGVATLDHLRDAARLNPHYEGNFASATYNRALTALSPKLRSLLPERTADLLEQVGNVSRYTTAQPRGSFVNNSNTFVAGVADYGAGAAEHAANAAAHGLPVGTITRRAFSAVRDRRKVRRSLSPGAGLGHLTEPGNAFGQQPGKNAFSRRGSR